MHLIEILKFQTFNLKFLVEKLMWDYLLMWMTRVVVLHDGRVSLGDVHGKQSPENNTKLFFK